MSSAAALGEAVLGLMPSVPGVPVDEGRATTAADAWYILDQRLPTPVFRSEAGTVHSATCAVTVRVVHQEARGCRVLLDHLVTALEGARPMAPGWQTTPLQVVAAGEPLEDPETVTPADGTVPLVAVVELEFTATALP